MRNIGFLFLPALVLGSLTTLAQDIREAYNLSDLTVQGTARSMGFGNALGSVGGDFSSLSVNPAGLGVYRSSELTFTPSLRINGTTSDYTGVNTMDNNTHFNINNFGVVLSNAPKGRGYDERKWKSVSFAFGMNRTADFNNNYTYQGKTNTSSGSQVFQSDANLDKADASAQNANSLGYLGYQSYLLNVDPNGNYQTIVPFNGGVNQLKSVQENGGVNEYTLSFGGNYREKLMLGATLGIPVFNYMRSTTYTETLADGNTSANPDGFSSFTYGETLKIAGAGINAKIGAIYKINDFVRLGAAFHSPTYYSISERSTPMLSATRNDTATVVSEDNGYILENRFNYSLTTPWKGLLSATFILNGFGFITADYEYVDYSSMRYQYSGGLDNSGGSFQEDETSINQQIKKTYQAASNFRLGGEAKISKCFMVRLGFGYYGNAYTPYGEANSSYYTTERIDVSGGFGFHFKHFFTDLGLVHSMYQGFEQPYSIDYSGIPSGVQQTIPTAKIDYNVNNLALTMGVKF